MDVWFSALCAQMQYLPPAAVHALHNDGFAVIPGPLPQEKLAYVAAAYRRGCVTSHCNASDRLRTISWSYKAGLMLYPNELIQKAAMAETADLPT